MKWIVGTLSLAATLALISSASWAYNSHDPKMWVSEKTNRLTGADVAGVRIGMTFDQVLRTLKASGFKTFQDYGTVYKPENHHMADNNQWVINATKISDPGIKLQIVFFGEHDPKGRWGMGNTIRVSSIDYTQIIPGVHFGQQANQAADALIQKAEQKYGNVGMVVSHWPDGSSIATWDLQFGQFLLNKIPDRNSGLNSLQSVVAAYESEILRRMGEKFEPSMRMCNAQSAGGAVTDSQLACQIAVAEKEQKTLSKSYAPVLFAGLGAEYDAPSFHLMLVSPYANAMFLINNGVDTAQLSNEDFHAQQKAAKQQTGRTAF
jgi:hypothetical protein